MSGQLHAPAALSPGNNPPVLNAEETGWAPEEVQTRWKEENCLSLAGNRTEVLHPIAKPTELSRLHADLVWYKINISVNIVHNI
jgi:hypothetical protein